jgi:hypothetical protein
MVAPKRMGPPLLSFSTDIGRRRCGVWACTWRFSCRFCGRFVDRGFSRRCVLLSVNAGRDAFAASVECRNPCPGRYNAQVSVAHQRVPACPGVGWVGVRRPTRGLTWFAKPIAAGSAVHPVFRVPRQRRLSCHHEPSMRLPSRLAASRRRTRGTTTLRASASSTATVRGSRHSQDDPRTRSAHNAAGAITWFSVVSRAVF